MKHSSLLLTSALLALSGVVSAGTILVPRDFATIQAAVTAAQAGDTILVSPGYYRENVTITTADLTLKGRNVTLDGAYAGTCLDVQADRVSISGLLFVNGGTASKTGFAAAGGGLNVAGDGASIVDCRVEACTSFGIKLRGNGRITGNDVSACMGPGIAVDSGNPSGEQVELTGNTIVRCAVGIVADNGPFLMARNSAINNTGDGFRLTFVAASRGTTPTASVFTRNKSIGNGGTGLLLLDESGAVTLIEKSQFDGNSTGLDLTGRFLTVIENNVSFSRTGGIFLKTDHAMVDANTLRRNTLVGIVVGSFDSSVNGQNVLMRNRIEANGGDGMLVTSSRNLVENNLFRDNKGDGVQVAAGANGNSLLGNSVRDSVNDGIDNWGTATLINFNKSAGNLGADLAGLGDGGGTTDGASLGNVQDDESGLTSLQELELDTLKP